MGISVFPVAAGGGVTQKVQEFTATGNFVTPSNVTAVEIFMVGGGGGGGSAFYTSGQNAAGGGGGGTVVTGRLLTVTPGTTYTVTIGAAGAGSTANATAGSDGGDSSFGSLLTVPGGGGGGSVDATQNRVAPRSRGTMGGSTSTVDWDKGQGGSGAASWLSPTIADNTTAVFAHAAGAGTLTSITNPMNGGFLSATQGERANPGLGIQGFGGGGAGGNSITTTYRGVSFHGGAAPGGSNVVGVNAVANKGGGGSGASVNTSPGRAGGNGGSGYAQIIYWS